MVRASLRKWEARTRFAEAYCGDIYGEDED
jgi:hypothetical protein